jgi:hypothetical protein
MNDLLLCIDDAHWDIITDVDGNRCAATYGDDPDTRRALAERIVLCWNACRGLTDDQIKSGMTPNAKVQACGAGLCAASPGTES